MPMTRRLIAVDRLISAGLVARDARRRLTLTVKGHAVWAGTKGDEEMSNETTPATPEAAVQVNLDGSPLTAEQVEELRAAAAEERIVAAVVDGEAAAQK